MAKLKINPLPSPLPLNCPSRLPLLLPITDHVDIISCVSFVSSIYSHFLCSNFAVFFFQSKMSDDDWNKEMYKYEKQMPASSKILMKTTQKHLPKRLTIRCVLSLQV